MKVRISYKRNIQRRIVDLKKTVKVDTQKMRAKFMLKLEGLFDMAVMLAKGEVQTQVEDGKRMRVTLKQRQMWARIAAYVAQIISGIAEGFDEKELDVQLDELERMVNEVKAREKSGGPKAAG